MAFDISSLSAYAENNGKQIATAAVGGAATVKMLIENKSAQFGVKGSDYIRKMSNTVNLVSAGSCGARNALGTTTLSAKKITVVPIKDENNLCEKTLWNTLYADCAAKGNAPDAGFTPEFAQTIMDDRAKIFSNYVETLVWNGDSAATGSTYLALIDGIIKQVGSGLAITATGSTLVEKMQTVFLSMPVAERTQDDFRIFIGEDKYAEYLVAVANKNLFNAADPNAVYGTTAKFQVVPGLNSVGKVYATRISNLQAGFDGEEDKATFLYSVETSQFYQDIHSSIGVAVIDTTKVGVATI